MKFGKILVMLLTLASVTPVCSHGESNNIIKYNGMTFCHQRRRPDELIITFYNGTDENIVIPESLDGYAVTAIGDEVFKNNKNIKNITLPDCLNYLGKEVFSNSTLESVNIPESLRIIPVYSFNNCTQLETVIFHDDILAISDKAFRNTPVEIPSELYDTVTDEYIYTSDTPVSFSDDEWSYTLWNDYGEASVSISSYNGNSTDVVIPDSIRGVEVAEIYIFNLDPSIKSLTFPKTITKLDPRNFRFRSPALEEVTLPPIDCIPSRAFEDCTNLKKINFQSNPETFTIDEYAFQNCPNIDYIPYPEGCKNITIGKKAFENTGVREVRIDFDSSIGESAFRGCQDLSYVELNNTHVNKSVFTDCPALKDVTVSGNSVLEEMSFSNCDMLKNITISDDTQVTNAVWNCPELMTINNSNVFDVTTGDFATEWREFIFDNFSGSDDVGFINQYVRAKAEKIIAEITSENMSDVQKIKAVHDWVCNNTVYDYEQSFDRKNHNDASVFMNDSTVCVGYARIANILYNTAGIESYYISGVDHAWNVVRAGSNYYHVDTTWDDGDVISYKWFLKSDREMRESGGSHAKWTAEIPSSMHDFQQGKTLPECTYSKGDVNHDSNTNIADMVMLNRYILCKKDIDYDSYILSDLTSDGIIDSFDLVQMRQLLTESGCYSLGDINRDNNIDVSDLIILNKYIHCPDDIDYDSYILSDLTSDGVIDSFDLVQMRKLLTESGCYSIGDINQDNKTDITDLILLNKYILCPDGTDYNSYILADLNSDGVIDSFDLVKMRQLLIR